MEQNYIWRDDSSLESTECSSFYGIGRLITACAPKFLRFFLMLPYWHPLFPHGLFYFGLSMKVLWALLVSLLFATCLSHTMFFKFITMIFGEQRSLWNLFLCSFSVTATYSPHFLYVPPSSTLKEYYTIWKRPLFTPINCTIFTKKIKFVTIEYLNNRGSNNLWYYCNVVVHEFRNWFSLNTSKGTGGVADKIIVSNCLQLENNSRGCNINFSEQDLKFRVEL